MSVSKVFARSIFDSRGNPTVEVDLYTDKGLFRAAVPSGNLFFFVGVVEIFLSKKLILNFE